MTYAVVKRDKAKGAMKDKQQTLPTLFQGEPSTLEDVDRLPQVWRELEDLTSPDNHTREEGLSNLVARDAHRRSPLVAYVLATRLTDPDLHLRYRAVQALGEVLNLRDGDDPTPELVRHHLQGFISHMRKRQIFALLQVAEQFGAAEESVASILNLCSFGGAALSEIINDRKAPLPVRQKAIFFSGQVGFVDTIPALERLMYRLQSGHEDQTHMDFVDSPGREGEGDLLIYARAALDKLQSSV